MTDSAKPGHAGRNRYRIAILAETFPPAGGGVPAAHYALYELLRTTHDVKLFAFQDARPSDDAVARSNGNPRLNRVLAGLAARYVKRADAAGDSANSRRIAATIPAIMRLNLVLARYRPAIIFVPDFAVPGLALARPKGARLIWMAHHNYRRFDDNALLPASGWYDSFFAHRLEKRALRKFDYAVFPSHYMERVFRETLDSGIPGKVIRHALPSGALGTFDRPTARKSLGMGADSILVYIPSGGTTAKGERYVFEIVRRLVSLDADVRFFISGDINPRLQVELSSVVPANRLITPGQLPSTENLRYASAADLAVSPTLIENYSCALLEAQALGIPCVTFDIGGNSELVRDGHTGYVVPYLDMESLITHSARLIADAEARRGMGEKARRHAADQCNPEELLRNYEEVMSAAADQRTSA